MKRWVLALLWLIAFSCLIVSSSLAVIADVSDADYYGTITVSNNSSATANVSCPVSNLSTPSFITNHFLNSSANNCAIQYSGGNIPFMPGAATNPWIIWVPAIGASMGYNDLLYTGNVSGGTIRYFPGTSGMTTADDPTLEFSSNFTIQQKGWIDTTAGASKYLVEKPGSFHLLVSDTISGNITASLSTSGGGTTENLVPNDVGDYTNINEVSPGGSAHWSVVDEIPANDADFVSVSSIAAAWYADSYKLQNTTIPCGGLVSDIDVHYRCQLTGAGTYGYVQAGVRLGGNEILGTAVQLWTGAGWSNLVLTSIARPGGGSWSRDDLNDLQCIINLQYSNAGGSYNVPWCSQIYVTVTYSPPVTVSVTGISSGNHTVTTSLASGNFTLQVDGSSAWVAFAGSVSDNNSAWSFLKNDSVPYLEYQKIWIGGPLRQHIQWNYNSSLPATFSDLSGTGNTAVPTFRTTSSSATVSANLTSFGPTAMPIAPAWSVGAGADFFAPPTMSGNFTSNVSDVSYPGKDIIEAVSTGGGVPTSLPKLLIPTFVILVISMMTSAFFASLRVSSLFFKAGILIALIGFAVALHLYDWWMVFFFVIFAVFIFYASKEGRR